MMCSVDMFLGQELMLKKRKSRAEILWEALFGKEEGEEELTEEELKELDEIEREMEQGHKIELNSR